MLKFIIILCLLLCSVFVSANKKPVFHHYTTEHGLSHNEVRVIRQAENGMLWLGTQNGLVSFDGYRFTVFKNKRNNSKTICGDKIYSLETSSLNGKIWVGTTVGLCVLDPLSGQSEAFPDTFQIKTNLHKTHIKFLYEDRIGYLWISASSGNYRYSIHHNTMERVFEGKNIKCVYEGREGVFWVCHDGILSRYDRNSDKIVKSYKSNIDHLYTDRFGVLWGVGQNGLYRYLPNLMEFEHLFEVKTKFNTGFNCITEDKNGRLVLGQYGGGISIYDPRLDEISHIIAKPGEVGSLSSDDVYDVYSDQAGVVWVGTQEGLDLYDWSRQRFEKWKHDPDSPKGLANSFVQYIYRDQQQNLWLGTRDGLDRFTGKDKEGMPQFEHYTLGFNQGDLHSNYIAGILVDSKKRLWAASWGNGLNVRYPNGKKWINFRHDENDSCSIASNDVISVLEDRRGRIWVGTLDGLSCLKEDKGKVCFKNYRSNSADSLSLFNHRIFKVFEDSRGRIWLASIDGGLSLMHEETDGKIWFQRFTHDPNNPKSIVDNEVFVIFEDSKQRLWIGTSPKGFCRVLETPDRKGQSNFSFVSYQEKDGLPDNEINGILEDSFGFLWISTNKGISRFNPEDETFVNYSEYDGVLKGKF
ncbi:MAG: hypothetical protein N4A74_08940, partial [Carboxylicivirga sp.]|nr:hypothetical protein [Carboxylicivirga sp.]